MSSFSYTLNARAHWALHRIALIAGDSDGADGHLNEAQALTHMAGYQGCYEDNPLPHLLADVPLLRANWHDGWGYCDNAPLASVWESTWTSDLDGQRETRASMASTTSGYLPGLEVSWQGGDSEPRYGRAQPTLEAAIEAARRMESDFHMTDGDEHADADADEAAVPILDLDLDA